LTTPADGAAESTQEAHERAGVETSAGHRDPGKRTAAGPLQYQSAGVGPSGASATREPMLDAECLQRPARSGASYDAVTVALDAALFNQQVWQCESRVEVLLRGHLWVENVLEQMLSVALARPAAAGLERLTWRQKLSLCDAVGVLTEADVDALAQLNKIRNRLTHDLSGEPTSDDVDRLITKSPEAIRGGAEAVRKFQKEERRDAIAGQDETLLNLRYWFLATVMYLDYRLETQAYEKRHHLDFIGAAAIQIAKKEAGETISWEEAERLQGLPRRPRPGDSFRGEDWAPS
jgi:hypothetical protein